MSQFDSQTASLPPLSHLVPGVEVLVRGVALPQALDEAGGGRDLPVEVLLPLLLLDLQREAGPENALSRGGE